VPNALRSEFLGKAFRSGTAGASIRQSATGAEQLAGRRSHAVLEQQRVHATLERGALVDKVQAEARPLALGAHRSHRSPVSARKSGGVSASAGGPRRRWRRRRRAAQQVAVRIDLDRQPGVLEPARDEVVRSLLRFAVAGRLAPGPPPSA